MKEVVRNIGKKKKTPHKGRDIMVDYVMGLQASREASMRNLDIADDKVQEVSAKCYPLMKQANKQNTARGDKEVNMASRVSRDGAIRAIQQNRIQGNVEAKKNNQLMMKAADESNASGYR
ncbi:hypothetical protein K2173_019727 [Erythroxylum novogranatense]|uniref:Uncharacterized protein n=1 Tax=Erythroxylum novogranatense TaxID=1862640 RepID=A0AAV8SMB5_9ROSI|nr:hypothetical protein K2173_019727 [Erythroxylum novogranatense]